MEDALTKFPTDEDLQDSWTKMEDALTKFPMDEDLQDWCHLYNTSKVPALTPRVNFRRPNNA